MSRQRYPAVSLIVSLFIAGCSTMPTVTSNYDHAANFSAYKTFGFFSPLGTDRSGYTTLITQALKNSTRHEMELRGYRYSETSPDVLINFNAKIENQIDIRPAPMAPAPMGYYGYRAGYYGGWGSYSPDVYRYTRGRSMLTLSTLASDNWCGKASPSVR